MMVCIVLKSLQFRTDGLKLAILLRVYISYESVQNLQPICCFVYKIKSFLIVLCVQEVVIHFI